MAKTKDYKHFCAAARSLEVIGEKWSLLIVRDLLRGPQRFSDLLRYLGAITPKWLSARLRELEEADIVERDAQEGRREVWYRLTEVGRDLEPVVEALVVWGVKHAMRPPLLGERVHSDIILQGMVVALNERLLAWPDNPVTWVFLFGSDDVHTLRFDGQLWSAHPGADEGADVVIESDPERLANILTAHSDERGGLPEGLTVKGDNQKAAEFGAVFLAGGR
ncbi:MAG: helix-turn-helix transcriptional regulator [Chloroflexi bacterium]|nr:helix-turn-helix transcriptional regulator [Chloroflexota bacterium]